MRSTFFVTISLVLSLSLSSGLKAQGLDDMRTFDWLLGFLEEECGCFPGGVTLVESKVECKALLAKTANRPLGHERMIYAIIRHMKAIGALSADEANTLRSMVPECPPQ